MTIHQAIPAIMAEIGSIGKGRENKQQGYQYRGIEDFYNVCQPLMVKYKVFSVPNVTSQSREERASKSGGVLIYTILTVEYTFFAEDGSSVKATVVGEGMDSGDKSSNKAMSVAHKYALAQMFAVPTSDMVDPEQDSPAPIHKGNGKPEPTKATNGTEVLALGERIKKLNATLVGNNRKAFSDAISEAGDAAEQLEVVKKWEMVATLAGPAPAAKDPKDIF